MAGCQCAQYEFGRIGQRRPVDQCHVDDGGANETILEVHDRRPQTRHDVEATLHDDQGQLAPTPPATPSSPAGMSAQQDAE